MWCGEQRIWTPIMVRRDGVALESEIADGATPGSKHRRLQPHRSLNASRTVASPRDCRTSWAPPAAMPSAVTSSAQPGLPLEGGGKRPATNDVSDEVQRVVRGHHQKTHVVDDVLRRRAARPSSWVGRGTAARTVSPPLARADRNLFREVSRRCACGLDAARHRRTGNGLRINGNGGRHHIDTRRG